MTLKEISEKLRYTTYDTPEQLSEDLANMLDKYREAVEASINDIRHRLLEDMLP